MLLHSLVFGPSNVALLSVYWGFIKHKKMYLFEQGCKPGPFFENIFKCAVTYRPNFYVLITYLSLFDFIFTFL